jgi:hypothetical protein
VPRHLSRTVNEVTRGRTGRGRGRNGNGEHRVVRSAL